MKVCSCCKLEKSLFEFNKNKTTKDKLKHQCKSCEKDYRDKNKLKIKQYYQSNKHIISEKGKKYRLDNYEKIIERERNYDKNNRHIRHKYKQNRRAIDSLFKLSCNIRTLIGKSFIRNGFIKDSKTNNILGCTFEEFKVHLEKQFTKGMNWSNHGEWHLDHIYPVSLAKTEEEIIKLNHYTNFQPLWAEDNLRKGNRLDY
jgi:hypothetical protein